MRKKVWSCCAHAAWVHKNLQQDRQVYYLLYATSTTNYLGVLIKVTSFFCVIFFVGKITKIECHHRFRHEEQITGTENSVVDEGKQHPEK